MGRKVRIEFDEVAGYPQIGTLHLHIDGKEIEEPMRTSHLMDFATGGGWVDLMVWRRWRR